MAQALKSYPNTADESKPSASITRLHPQPQDDLPEVNGRCLVALLGNDILETLPRLNSRRTEDAAYDKLDAIRADIERIPAVTIGGAQIQIAHALSVLTNLVEDGVPPGRWEDYERAERSIRNAFATINSVLGFPFDPRLAAYFGVAENGEHAHFILHPRERANNPLMSEAIELSEFLRGLTPEREKELTGVMRQYGGTDEFDARVTALGAKWKAEDAAASADAQIFRLGAQIDAATRAENDERSKTETGTEPGETEDARIDAAQRQHGLWDAITSALALKAETVKGVVEQVRIAKVRGLLEGSYVDAEFMPVLDNLLGLSGAVPANAAE